MKDNEFVKFEVQNYLKSENKLTNKFRTRMVEN